MGVQGLVVKLEWPEQQSKNIEANASIMIMFKNFTLTNLGITLFTFNFLFKLAIQ